MENKIYLKRYLINTIIIITLFLFITIIFNYYTYNKYTKNFNYKINDILIYIKEKYPNTNEIDIVKILNSDNNYKTYLSEYGIDLSKDSILLKNNIYFKKFLIINIFLVLGFSSIIIIQFISYNKKKEQELLEITNYMEEINNKNYKLDIDNNSESEYSILKNEIYKMTVMLKEEAINAYNDKINVKNSLRDISHQLKTPLTAIIIILDNLIDNPNMDNKTREDFVKEIRREILNINFLIASILKLSEFDANVITFQNKETKIHEIIDIAITNVSLLADLKNINIIVNGNKKDKIVCDFMWQKEAITNIIKNSLEYSPANTNIIISYEKNKIYTCLTIKDSGPGIKKEDLPHIFERFYSGSNKTEHSIGIGLSLAKTIIEKNNGTIEVESSPKGTTFIIKYFN